MSSKKVTLSVKNGNLSITSNLDEVPSWFRELLSSHKPQLISMLNSENSESDEVEKRLKRLWVNLTKQEPQKNTSFFNLTTSSLDIIKLKQKIFSEFNLDIPVGDLYKKKIFSDQVHHIETQIAKEVKD
ncbi:hypothetical protein Sden_1175 [Shewanella denitrificans OS217]|jgi:hypothetical protein|uniref:Carrier domain-containing protein n=1 Tax=Shewanella denitrificans (strain OS217 / ATCC BAA-1090 / DSM 15013) TaxID=318161 RepID=Q12Q15_SHEDO|nr:acyl carrier protein [Shewanella denitrificans]ABE54461.1 hypothetical protein Sden_1175 [Shewanella denitrificans OS217]